MSKIPLLFFDTGLDFQRRGDWTIIQRYTNLILSLNSEDLATKPNLHKHMRKPETVDHEISKHTSERVKENIDVIVTYTG